MASVAHRTNHTCSRGGTSVSLEGGRRATRTHATLEGPSTFETSASFEGPDPSSESPHRSRVPTPQASLCLTRGLPQPVAPHLFPNRDIKCSNTSRVPRSKVNPRHADLLTPLGNLTPALFEQLATVQPSLVLYTGCAGWPVSFLGAVPPAPVPPPFRTPQKGTAAPSRSVRPPT
jgi:hypothetical protein